MTKAERKRLFDAMQVETNPLRKLAYRVALGWVPFDVVLLNAWRAAETITIKTNKKGPGVELSELIAGPTFARVKRELQRLYPDRNISKKISDYSLRRSLRRLRLPLRRDKPGPHANEK